MAAETEFDRFEDDEEEIAGDALAEEIAAGESAAESVGETAEADDADEDEELYEVEVDEDAIVGYLVDEDDNEIGFIVEEDGVEVEYYYAEEDGAEYVAVDEKPAAPASKNADDDEEYDFGITREGVAETTDNMNAVFREGVALGHDLKDAWDDISEGLSGLPFKKKR